MDSRPTYDSRTRSEDSVYFDAPIMHFFTEKDSGNSSLTLASSPSTNTDSPLNATNTDVSKKPSITFTRSAAGNGQEANDSEHNNDCGSQSDKPRNGYQLTDPGPVSGHNGSASNVSQTGGDDDTKPIPVVWSPTSQGSQRRLTKQNGDSPAKRAQSLRSLRPVADQDGTSIGTGVSTYRRRRLSLGGGNFTTGAGTVGPAAMADLGGETFQARSAEADAVLTRGQKSRIDKNSCECGRCDLVDLEMLNECAVKDGKRVAKVVKEEGKAEKKALEAAIRELADIQRLQKDAIKVRQGRRRRC